MGARSALKVPEEASTTDDVLQSGKGVRIILELYPDGRCLHRIDGVTVHTHYIQVR